MALEDTDLFLVQRDDDSYKMSASRLKSYIDVPAVGDGQITIVQPGTDDQSFTVNQDGDTTITLRNDSLSYDAGDGLSLSGTTFSLSTIDAFNVLGTGSSSGVPSGTKVLPNMLSGTPGNGTSGQYLQSDGDGTFSWQTLPSAEPPFPSGTTMLFRQSTPPTGWVKQTNHNNKALRIVSGDVGSGGSKSFTGTFNQKTPSGSVTGSISGNTSNRTLSVNQMPSHDHGLLQAWNPSPQSYYTALLTGSQQLTATDANVSNTGGSAAHSHGLTNAKFSGSLSMDSMDFRLQYVDVIIAVKS